MATSIAYDQPKGPQPDILGDKYTGGTLGYSGLIRSIPNTGTMGSAASQEVLQNIINDAVSTIGSNTNWTADETSAFLNKVNNDVAAYKANNPGYAPFVGTTTNQAMGTTEVTQAQVNDALVQAAATRDNILGDTTLTPNEQTLAIQSAVADILSNIGIGVEQSTINV